MVVVCLGLAPFLSGLLFSLDETQIWLGDLRVVVVVGPVCLLVCFDLPAFMDQLCPCTNVFLTAYAHVRTEPQSDIGQTRGKKVEMIQCYHLLHELAHELPRFCGFVWCCCFLVCVGGFAFGLGVWFFGGDFVTASQEPRNHTL